VFSNLYLNRDLIQVNNVLTSMLFELQENKKFWEELFAYFRLIRSGTNKPKITGDT
jgi:hypothetical protein